MKKIFIFSLILTCLLCFSACQNKTSSGFHQTLNQAYNAAQKSNKDILMVFTMDGDDAYSSTFISDVLQSADFEKDIGSKYEVVHVDFGQKTYEKTVVREEDDKKTQQKASKFADLMQENMKTANLLSIKTTPSYYIFTKDKYFISALEYPSEISTTSMFNELIETAQPAIDQVHELVQTINTGSSEEKLQAINTLYDATDSTFRVFIYDLVIQYMKLDKKNETGNLGKFTLAKADLEALNLFSEGNPLDAAKKYADVAQDPSLEPEQRQNAYYMAAYLMTIGGSPDYQPIIRYLKNALDAAPESDAIPHIQQIYDSFVMMLGSGQTTDSVQ